MAKIRRNGPCPCGSGSKTKCCCFAIQKTEAVHCLPRQLCTEVVLDLKGTDDIELRWFFDRLLSLPELDTALQTRLGVFTPDMGRAIEAPQNGDDVEFDQELHKVVPAIDSIDRRMELARAVIALRDRGRISPKLAAVAVIDLDGNKSNLFLASVARSLAVAGDVT